MMPMKSVRGLVVAVTIFAVALAPWRLARSQGVTPGLPLIPMGYCQIPSASLSAATTFASCVRASFTGTGSGTTLTTASVAGVIQAGDGVSGTGVPAGTTIVNQLTGTAGGAGTYQTSAATTSSSASLTSGGIPTDANGHLPDLVVLQAVSAPVRWRDDGGVPTAAIGMEVVNGIDPFTYVGTMSKLQFIAASGTPELDAAFYRTGH